MIRVTIKESRKRSRELLGEGSKLPDPELLATGQAPAFKNFFKGLFRIVGATTVVDIVSQIIPARDLYIECMSAGGLKSECRRMFNKRLYTQGFWDPTEELGKMKIRYREAWDLYRYTRGRVGEVGPYRRYLPNCDLDTPKEVRKKHCSDFSAFRDRRKFTKSDLRVIRDAKRFRNRNFPTALGAPIEKILRPAWLKNEPERT